MLLKQILLLKYKIIMILFVLLVMFFKKVTKHNYFHLKIYYIKNLYEILINLKFKNYDNNTKCSRNKRYIAKRNL